MASEMGNHLFKAVAKLKFLLTYPQEITLASNYKTLAMSPVLYSQFSQYHDSMMPIVMSYLALVDVLFSNLMMADKWWRIC